MKELPVLKARKPKNRTLRHRQINEGRKVSFVAIITPTQWTLLRWSTQRICHPDSPYLFGKWLVLVVRFTWEFSEALFTRKKNFEENEENLILLHPKYKKEALMEPHVPRPSPSTRSPSHMGWSPISGLIFFLSPEVQATIYLTYNTPLETLESPAIFNRICNDVGPQHSIWPKWTCKRKC